MGPQAGITVRSTGLKVALRGIPRVGICEAKSDEAWPGVVVGTYDTGGSSGVGMDSLHPGAPGSMARVVVRRCRACAAQLALSGYSIVVGLADMGMTG